MECKKCKTSTSSSLVLLRQKDAYCEECFLTNTNHKFRSCIGKNRILYSKENTLLAVSGGIGSAVLLDLVHSGISLDNHKVLRVNPFCVHVVGIAAETQELNAANTVIEQCSKYGFDVYVLHISDFIRDELQIPEKNCVPVLSPDAAKKFTLKWNKMTATELNDVMVKIRRRLFIKVAELLHCNYIFSAETSTTLASSLLSNIALGRGSQIEHDIGFSDSRNNIKILRPMKDINKEELDHYATIKKLEFVHGDATKDASLQSLINSFVVDLQVNYQATISTVCKTAEKIGSSDHEDNSVRCIFCQSAISWKRPQLTAREATNFSRAVCYGRLQQLDENNLANNSYCYACIRNQGLNKK